MFSLWDEKYALEYSRGIFESLTPGSIYFTGVPMGAHLIPALQNSESNGDPCFTMAPWELVEEPYRSFMRNMYGGRIYVLSEADAQKCFEDYSPGAQLRGKNGQLRREDWQRIGDLLAKAMFEKNPDREFYVEEGLPVDWMYPCLEPHGLLMKLNREPLSRISEETVAKDREFWMNYLKPMIGGWLTCETPFSKVAAFLDKVDVKHDLTGFEGDPRFIQDTRGQRQIFAKLRTAIGGIYAWRAEHATDPAEKKRMSREAEFAFCQALAIWPASPESSSPAIRYIALLKKQGRQSESLEVRNIVGKCFPKKS